MHAPENLWTHHLHLTIGLNQQSRVSSQGGQRLLTQQFGVGALAGGPFGHQQISPFDQAGAAWRGKTLFQPFELADQGIEELIPVLQEQRQSLSLRTKVVQFLAQAFLFKAGQAPQGHR